MASAGTEPNVASAEREEVMQQPASTSSDARSDVSEAEGVKSSGDSSRVVGRKRKWRKATNTIRREKKQELREEVNELREQLEELKSQIFGVPTEKELASDRKCKSQVIENRRMRRALLSQFFTLAPVQALLDEYALMELEAGSPLHQFIHLKSSWQDRHDTLKAAKPIALRKAKLFLEQRAPHWNPLRETRQERSFESSTGDACIVCWASAHFLSARSVQRGFETVQRFFCDLEIRISDHMSFITVREDDDYGGTEIPQNRLLSRSHSGHQIESNSVFFSEFYPESTLEDGRDGGGYGIVVADFVDVDDRHPYHSGERIRRDVSSVIKVTAVPRTDSTDGEVVIVLTNWVFAKLHRPTFAIPPSVWSELRKMSDNWTRLLHPSIIELPE